MAKLNKYGGVIVPMVTPLLEDLSVDSEAVKRIIDTFIENKIVPFVIGSTGEAPSLSLDQRLSIVESSVDAIDGRTILYAGISGDCLQNSITEGQIYAEIGADVLVATPPAYYPMNADQITTYFQHLADALTKPLMIYNMPVATKHSISVEVVEKLSHHPNIIGIKDSERDEDRMYQILEMIKHRDDFVHLLGWAAKSVDALKAGSAGIVPSTGNLTPELYELLFNSVQNGDFKKAEEMQELTNYIGTLYQKERILSESIPALKLLMSLKGLCEPYVAPPMYRLGANDEASYLAAMKNELQKMMI